MLKSLLLAFGVLVAFAASAQTPFSGGSGTEEDPYLISSTDDMLELSDSTKANRSYCTGKHFMVTSTELDFKGVTFSSNVLNGGIIEGSFNGTFDGQGVVIKNLDLRVNVDARRLTAYLFYTIGKQGVVKNIAIDKSCLFSSRLNGGAITWDCYGTIENCHNYADFDGLAGIAGYINAGAVIRNCSNNGSGMQSGIACMYDGNGEALIEDCQNDGDVTHAGIIYMGGYYTRVERCTNSGKVEGENASGIGSGIITDCVNTGDVKGSRLAAGISTGTTDILKGNRVTGGSVTVDYGGSAGAIALGIGDGSRNNYYTIAGVRGTADGDVTTDFRAVRVSNVTADSPIAISGLPTGGDGVMAYEGRVYYANGLTMNVGIDYQQEVPAGHHVEYEVSSGSIGKNADGTYRLTMSDADMKVTAQLAANQYRIDYLDNEANPWKQAAYLFGETIVPLNYAPTVSGYTFTGWSGLPDDLIMPAHDLTAVPQYAVRSYRLTYYVDNDIVFSDSVAYGTPITPMEKPQKEGYTFDGWYDLPQTMPDHNVTVFGYFKVNSYQLSFTVDGKDYVQPRLVAFGKPITVPATKPRKEGYTFSAWSSLPDDRLMPAHDVVSEAQFTINVHELRWVVDGETLHKDSLPYGAPIEAWEVPVREGQTFSGWSSYPETMPDRDVTVVGSFDANTYTITYMVDGEVYQTVQAAYGSPLILIEEPVKEGYTFSGWGYYPATMPAENIIVSGSFSVNQYLLTIIFDGDTLTSQRIDYGTAITLPDVAERVGVYVVWSGQCETMPAHDVTITGVYEYYEYELAYLVDGNLYQQFYLHYGDSITPIEEPAKTGYTFSGWSEMPAVMPDHDVHVTGSFTVNRHQITFVVDDEVLTTDSLNYHQRINLPTVMSPEGYQMEWENNPYFMPDSDLVVRGKHVLMPYMQKTIDRVLYYIALRDGWASVYRYEGSRTQLTIPDSIEVAGLKIAVTGIADEAFRSHGDMTSVRMPNGLRRIGESAFSGCKSLQIESLPDSLVRIGKQAFRDCWGLTSLVIPDTCLYLEDEVFLYCTRLTSVKFQRPVKELGNRLFQNCYNLSFVQLPAEMRAVSEGMFLNCSSLPVITLPDSLKVVGDKAFAGCGQLKTVYSNAVTLPQARDNVFDDNLTGATLYVLPDLVDDYAANEPWNRFGTISELRRSTLTYLVDGEPYATCPDVLAGTAIVAETAPQKEDRTFSGWRNLPQVMPTHDVTVTGAFAYKITYIADGEERMTQTVYCGDDIQMPDRLRREGYTVTADSLPAVMPARDLRVTLTYTINSYVVTYVIEGEVFEQQTVEYGAAIPLPEAPQREGFDFDWIDVPARMPAHDLVVEGAYTLQRMAGAIINGIAYHIYLQERWAEVVALPEGNYSGEVVIPQTVRFSGVLYPVTSIGSESFRNCKQLTVITIPESIDNIGKQAFRDCWGLTTITVPGSVQYIEEEAFMYCSNMTSATFAEGVSELPDRLFQGCTHLTEVLLPASLEQVGEETFLDCSHLQTVQCDAFNPPSAYATTFKGVPVEQAVLVVPADAVAFYQATSPWSRFRFILSPADYAGIMSPSSDSFGDRSAADRNAVFSIDGKHRSSLGRGLNIVRYGDGSVRKVVRR